MAGARSLKLRIDRLDDAAVRLREALLREDASAARIVPLLEEIHGFDRRLTLLEERFSAVLGEAVRVAKRALSALMLLTGVVSVLAGWLLSRRVVAYDRHMRRQQALAESEAQARAVLRAAPYAIVITRLRDGMLLYTNRRAIELTRVPAEVRGGQLQDRNARSGREAGDRPLRRMRGSGLRLRPHPVRRVPELPGLRSRRHGS